MKANANTLLPVDALARIMNVGRAQYNRATDLHTRVQLARRIDTAKLALGEDYTARLLVGSLDDSD